MTLVTARKRPLAVEAMQWDGTFQRFEDLLAWIDARHKGPTPADVIQRSVTHDSKLRVKTLEGEVTAVEGDWIIRGVNGEYYPCKADIFAKTYDIEGEQSLT